MSWESKRKSYPIKSIKNISMDPIPRCSSSAIYARCLVPWKGLKAIGPLDGYKRLLFF